MKKSTYGLNVGVSLALALSAVGCIDHDYDLSEDIDLTVNVGGESFSIPKSSTDLIKLSEIFSLDEGSSIRTVSQGEYGLAEGDYVLVQSGDPTTSDFHIGDVTIGDLSHNVATTTPLPFPYIGNSEITADVPPLVSSINLSDNNVTRDLVSVSNVGLDMTLKLNVAYTSQTDFSGTAYIEAGYTVTFDPSWYLEIKPESARYIRLTSHNVIEFTQRAAISANSPLDLYIGVKSIDLSSLPAGQGLYAPGHFLIDSKITSEGRLTIESRNNITVGTIEQLQLVTTTDLLSAKIISVTGVIDPQITIDDTQFTINDVPDFLSDDENSLDVDNPRFYVTVTNNSPVRLELNAQLASFSNNNTSSPFAIAKIGAANGTDPVIIDANATTQILISQKPISGTAAKNIVVNNLSSLISTIPDFMRFEKVECHAVQEEITIALAPTYDFRTDYEAVIPLSFGPAMNLHYTHEETDWDIEDDLNKIEFHKARVSLTAINTIPLAMTPQVIALDREGNEIDDVTATVTGMVAAGSISSPSSSELKILLESTTRNLGRLDGVRLLFDAKSDPSHTGDNLNESQALKFNDISVEILGGVTIDLN